MAIHSSGQTIFSLAHVEGITLGAGGEVDEIAGGESGMGVDVIVEVGGRAREGQAAGVYGAGFTGVSGRETNQGWDEKDGEQGVDGGSEDGRR